MPPCNVYSGDVRGRSAATAFVIRCDPEVIRRAHALFPLLRAETAERENQESGSHPDYDRPVRATHHVSPAYQTGWSKTSGAPCAATNETLR
jgi:hypothetical protein